MGPTWVLSAPDGPHVGPMNLAIRDGNLRCIWMDGWNLIYASPGPQWVKVIYVKLILWKYPMASPYCQSISTPSDDLKIASQSLSMPDSPLWTLTCMPQSGQQYWCSNSSYEINCNLWVILGLEALYAIKMAVCLVSVVGIKSTKLVQELHKI